MCCPSCDGRWLHNTGQAGKCQSSLSALAGCSFLYQTSFSHLSWHTSCAVLCSAKNPTAFKYSFHLAGQVCRISGIFPYLRFLLTMPNPAHLSISTHHLVPRQTQILADRGCMQVGWHRNHDSNMGFGTLPVQQHTVTGCVGCARRF